MSDFDFHALILAAGQGSRLGGTPKQYRQLQGRDIWLYAVLALASHSACRGGVIVCPDGEEAYHAAKLAEYQLNHWMAVTGGAKRQDSVKAGLEQLAATKPSAVFIHDAARPFLPRDMIDRMLDLYHQHPPHKQTDGQITDPNMIKAIVPALPPGDSLKTVNNNQVTGQIDREQVIRVQTPQLFHFDTIYELHQCFSGAGFTDDSSLAEEAGIPVHVIEGDPRTFKITTESDWIMAQMMAPAQTMTSRVGFGYDVHRFEETHDTDQNTQIMLCGIAIDHDQAVIAHSDGDVGLHALTDAILGAIGDGDIGTHFPPSDEKWRHASSDLFLIDACRRLAENSGKLVNCDITIIAEAPKVLPHRDAMVEKLAELTGLDQNAVSVKATTSEGMGFIGHKLGLAAHAVVSVLLPVSGIEQ